MFVQVRYDLNALQFTENVVFTAKDIQNPHTVVGDYINTMKTSYDFNFDLNQAVYSIDTLKYRSQRKISIKKASL